MRPRPGLSAVCLAWALPAPVFSFVAASMFIFASAVVFVFASAAMAEDEVPAKTPQAAAKEAPAQPEAAKPEEPAADAAPAGKAKVSLAVEQGQVAEKFRDLERVLIRMAEVTAHTDPRRAALLRQAIALSKDRDIENQFDELVALLKQDSLSASIKSQGEVQSDLAKLLELLLSEDRGKRLESEKQRIREYLRRVNQIIKEQKTLQGETTAGENEKKLAGRQGELGGKTGQLAKDIAKNEEQKINGPSEAGGKPADDKKDAKPEGGDKPSAAKPDKPQSDGGKTEDKTGDAKKSDKPAGDAPSPDKAKEPADKPTKSGSKDDKPKESKSAKPPGDSSKAKPPQDGNPSDGKPSEGKADGSSPDDKKKSDGQGQGQEGQAGESEPAGKQPEDGNPARRRLQDAEQRMQEARRKLDEARRQGAVEEQQKAIEALELAKAELERILRQLREEERARMLAMLEGRFRKMLDMQIQVYEGTKRLDRKPEPDRTRDDEIESGRLSRKESEIVGEADRALAVLREEGSAVAMPEAVGEMRDDMEQIVGRLSQAKVNEITQKIEEDVIAALEEMIAALKKAQQDLADKKMKPGPAGEPMDPPLVDKLAELKVIRAMQMRINNRTQRYADMLKKEQAEQPELLTALKHLADREQRIYRVTRDIVVGRNQ